MNRIVRRTVAPAALVLLVLGLVAPGASLAAEPIPGVVFDATVEVRFVDVDDTPIAGGNLVLVATTTDFPEDDPIVVLRATTDASGLATFAEVPRAEAGAPTVFLTIDGEAQAEDVDENLCRSIAISSGMAEGIASPPASTVVVKVTGGSSSIACRKLVGRVVNEDGAGVAGQATISVTLPEGGGAWAFPLAIGANGRFDHPLPAFGTTDAPAQVTFEFQSALRTETFGDCDRELTDVATWTSTLALETVDPEVLALVAEEHVASEVCGTVSRTDPPAAARTLPPTDLGATPGADRSIGAGVLLVVGIALLAVGAATAGAATRARRRR